jgi:hypothetical protein
MTQRQRNHSDYNFEDFGGKIAVNFFKEGLSPYLDSGTEQNNGKFNFKIGIVAEIRTGDL